MPTTCVVRAPSITVLSLSSDADLHASLREEFRRDTRIGLIDGVWNGSKQLLARMRLASPEVVLLDMRCSFYEEALSQIQLCDSNFPILLVCDQCTDEQVAAMIAHGVRGCMLRTAPAELWRKAIWRVYEGEIWATRSIMRDVVASLIAAPPAVHLAEEGYGALLTDREVQVARLVAQGMTNKEIARSMTISDTTVKTHLKHIFSKLHVTRRAHLLGVSGSHQ